MSEASPRPWQVRYGDTVADATGARVCGCWRPENAALIVAAVNKHGMPITELIKGYDVVEAECVRLRAELAAAGELLQCWLSEAPGDPETHEWLARNGFKDPYPECWQRDGEDADAPAPCFPAPSVVSSSPNRTKP